MTKQYAVYYVTTGEIWRGPYDEENVWQAQRFVDEWLKDGGREGVFEIVQREVGPWGPVDSD